MTRRPTAASFAYPQACLPELFYPHRMTNNPSELRALRDAAFAALQEEVSRHAS